jgi:DNA-binding LacI/PurR family transcriptional regulator
MSRLRMQGIAAKAGVSLATVRVPAREMREKKVSVLLDMIEGRGRNPRRVILPTEIGVKQSCRERDPARRYRR